jgi:hypothetical protein
MASEDVGPRAVEIDTRSIEMEGACAPVRIALDPQAGPLAKDKLCG